MVFTLFVYISKLNASHLTDSYDIHKTHLNPQGWYAGCLIIFQELDHIFFLFFLFACKLIFWTNCLLIGRREKHVFIWLTIQSNSETGNLLVFSSCRFPFNFVWHFLINQTQTSTTSTLGASTLTFMVWSLILVMKLSQVAFLSHYAQQTSNQTSFGTRISIQLLSWLDNHFAAITSTINNFA